MLPEEKLSVDRGLKDSAWMATVQDPALTREFQIDSFVNGFYFVVAMKA